MDATVESSSTWLTAGSVQAVMTCDVALMGSNGLRRAAVGDQVRTSGQDFRRGGRADLDAEFTPFASHSLCKRVLRDVSGRTRGLGM